MGIRTEKMRTKRTILSCLALLMMIWVVGCTPEAEVQNSIVEEEEITTILEEREMEIETQEVGDETWVNATSDTMTLHYWSNEEDNTYIQQSLVASLRMAENMDGEVSESNGLTEIIIDWSVVGQDFYSVHLYEENRRIHIRLYDLDELEEIKNLILR